jgi:hypothetical protein
VCESDGPGMVDYCDDAYSILQFWFEREGDEMNIAGR